jgi:hypothetical protein
VAERQAATKITPSGGRRMFILSVFAEMRSNLMVEAEPRVNSG